MLKPIQWKTFPRDFGVIQIGFAIFGLAIACLVRANLGTNSWVVLEVALSNIFHITPGTAIQIVGWVILGAALLLREPVGWGTLANILSIGWWTDRFLDLIPVFENYPLRFSLLAIAIVALGQATAIYISANGGAGPRDSMMMALTRLTGWKVQYIRGAMEVTVVFVGWLLGGPVGIGTLIFALLIGPSVQLGFKVFKVQVHKAPQPLQPISETKL